MLAPRASLLVCVAVFVAPIATIAGAVPDAFWMACGLLAAFGVVVLLDALLAGSRLSGITVNLPQLARLHKDRQGNIELTIANERKVRRIVRIGLALPRFFEVEREDLKALLPAGEASVRLRWPCKPTRRGLYIQERVYMETASALGFWAVRKVCHSRGELRVYPNLFEDSKAVAALFLKRGAIGSHTRHQAGEGREFEKLREYLHGDSIEDIHWKASARRGRLVTKLYQVEQAQEVYVVVDASRLGAREVDLGNGRGATTMLERFVSGALILGLAAQQQGDQFGLITFSDKVHTFLRAKNGQAHFNTCRERLYTLQSESVTPDYQELFAFIRLKLRKRALLVFLTALDDPLLAEAFSESADLVCRQHLMLVNILKPEAAVPVFSRDAETVDEMYEHLGGHLHWNQLRHLEKNLRRKSVRMSMLDAGKFPAQLVAQHADIKGRQLL